MLDIVLVMFELRKLCQTFYLTNLDADILNIRRNMPQKVKVGEGGGGLWYISEENWGGGGLRKNYSPWGGRQGDFLDIA